MNRRNNNSLPMLSEDEQMKVYMYLTNKKFRLGSSCLSPIPADVRGSKDTHNSFNIYKSGDGKIRWKDFGGEGDLGGDIYDFIICMRKDVKDFGQAIKFYNNRIRGSRFITPKDFMEQKSKNSGRVFEGDVTTSFRSEFHNYELGYWRKRYNITDPNILLDRRIYALDEVNWGNFSESFSRLGDPAFVYDLSEEGDMSSFKTYRPLNKFKKWRSWNLHKIPCEGYYLLPDKVKTLIFTSSKKDGTVAELTKGVWHCLNPVGESSWRKILTVHGEIDRLAEDKYILFDGDKAGYSNAELFAKESGWINLTNKFNYPENTKDLAEIVENYNYKTLYKLIIDAIQS